MITQSKVFVLCKQFNENWNANIKHILKQYRWLCLGLFYLLCLSYLFVFFLNYVKLDLQSMSRTGASSLKEVRLQKEIDKIIAEKEQIKLEHEVRKNRVLFLVTCAFLCAFVLIILSLFSMNFPYFLFYWFILY